MEKKNYTLGRGEIWFSRFRPGTRQPTGFRYIGNTPEVNFTIESDRLDHYSADYGIREKDDGVTLEVTRTGSLITDQISLPNIALFFFGQDNVIVETARSNQTDTIEDVLLGRGYFIGATAANPLGVRGLENVVVSDGPPGAFATGTVALSGNPTAADTVTLGSTTYTFVSALTGANDVLIGATAADTAANLAAAINGGAGVGTVYGVGTVLNPDASATVATATVTAKARTAGTAGNSIALAKTGTNITVSGATLTGGTGTGATTFVEGTDYTVDINTGMLVVLDTGSIAEGDDLTVTYDVQESVRDSVVSGTEAVEGALLYKANNPKGKNIDYYMAYVNISPNGDLNLKGDEWQQIPLSLEILKGDDAPAIMSQGRPVFEP